MKLTDRLKEKVDQTKTGEEAKGLIREAETLLEDDELDAVAGGVGPCDDRPLNLSEGVCKCPKVGPRSQFCPVCHTPYV